MRSIILLAVLLLSAQLAKADPVVLGEGSALMSMPVASCSWSQGCGWNVQITNTSSLAVNGVTFGGLSSLTCFIPSGESLALFILVGSFQGATAIDLYNSTTIYTGSATIPNPEPVTLLLLGTGIAALAARRRARE